MGHRHTVFRIVVGAGLGLLLGVSSCRPATQVSEQGKLAIRSLAGGQQEIANVVTGVRLTVPKGWKPVTELRQDADLYVRSPQKDLYVLILSDPQDPTTSRFSLENHSLEYRKVLARQLDSSAVPSMTLLNDVGGNSAVQYTLEGNIDGTPVTYLHTTVKGEAAYYQVVGWAERDQFQAQENVLAEVISSFEELPTN